MAKIVSDKKSTTTEAEELLSYSQGLLEKIQENPTRAAAYAAAVAGAVLVVFLGFYLREKAGEKRLVLVSEAVTAYRELESAGADAAASRQTLQDLAGRYSGTPQGGQALFFLGGAQVEEGDYAAAVETYARVRKNYARNVNLATAAALAEAYTRIMAGEDEQAATIFEELLASEEKPVPRAQVRIDLAALYEREGKKEEAAGLYRTLVEDDAESPWGKKAAQKLESLEGA